MESLLHDSHHKRKRIIVGSSTAEKEGAEVKGD